MATIKTDLICNLNQPVAATFLHGNLFSQDNAGNTINVYVMKNGEPATIGGTVSANVIRADGNTVAVSGAIDGNKAYVILPQACYAVPGRVEIIIKLTQSTTITTIAAIVANVYRSTTDTVVDPGTIIPSISSLIAEIEEAVDSIPVDYTGLLHTIAADYSSSKTYPVVGTYAWQGGVLKRNIVPITTAETYTAAHWTNAVIGDDLSALKSALDTNVPSLAKSVGFVETSFQYKTNEAHSANSNLLLMQVKQGEKYRIGFNSTSSILIKVYAHYSDGTTGNVYQKSNTSGEVLTSGLTASKDIIHFGAFVDDAVANGTLVFNVTKDGILSDIEVAKNKQIINESTMVETAGWQPKVFGKLSNSDTNLFPFINSITSLETTNGELSDISIRLKNRIVIPNVWKTYHFFWSGVDFTEYPNMILKVYTYDQNNSQLSNSTILDSSHATRSISVSSSAVTMQLAIRTEDGQKLITPAFLYDNGIRLYCGLDPITSNDEFDALYELSNLKPSIVKRMQNSTEQLVGSNEQLFKDLNYGLPQNLVPRYIEGFKNINRNGVEYLYMLTSGMIEVDPSYVRMYGYWSGVDFSVYPSIAVIVYYYDSTETYISSSTILSSSYATRTFLPPTNCKYIKISINTNDGNANLDRSYLYENGIRLYIGYKQITNDNQFDALYIVGNNTKTALPNYWKSYLDTKEDTIKTLVEGSDDVFFFVTDTHDTANQMWSPNIIRNIQNRIKIDSVICGGDFANKGDNRRECLNQIDNWLERCDRDWMCIRGNHDDNSEGGTGEVTAKDFYTHAVRPIGNKITLMESNRPVYYYDNSQTKIRYIMLDASNRYNDADISDQVAWMQSKMSELSSGWGVVIIAHMYWLNKEHDVTAVGTQIKEGIDSIYDSINADVIGYICGHTHQDYGIETQKGYPIISTTCDGAVGTAEESMSVGTTNEQAFDIYGIDKENRTINTVRIGYGTASRTFSY